MRDITVLGIIAALAAYALVHPWVGIMGWTWLSLMNPHALGWELRFMPVAAAMAIATLIGIVISKDRKTFYVTPETAALMAFMLWMTMTLIFSIYFEWSTLMWKRVMKIDFMVLVALIVLYSKTHITTLVWVVAGSIGFYGFKGGLFTVATGGSYLVWGPTGTYIEGNNELALALILIIPLINFLYLTHEGKWTKRGLMLWMLLCAVAALGSHSRGALLAIGAMGGLLWLRSPGKLQSGLAILLIGIVALFFMPEKWMERMTSIGEYKSDASALGRLNAWSMAWNLASDRFLGGGFEVYTPEIFAQYAPVPWDLHQAHSIYFQVLGEHGFFGLFLFLLMWGLVWRQAGKLRKDGRANPETLWVSHLGAMCQVSLAGYAVGGAFLSLAYFDLPYNILLLVVLGRRWLDRKGWIEEAIPGRANTLPRSKATPDSNPKPASANTAVR